MVTGNNMWLKFEYLRRVAFSRVARDFAAKMKLMAKSHYSFERTAIAAITSVAADACNLFAKAATDALAAAYSSKR